MMSWQKDKTAELGAKQEKSIREKEIEGQRNQSENDRCVLCNALAFMGFNQ